MLATLALAVTFVNPAPTTNPAKVEMAVKRARAEAQYSESRSSAIYLQPIDDIWVYSHAGDPEKDEFLRAWGSEGRAVSLPGDDPQMFSFSLLRWDLSGFPKNTSIAGAEVVLMHAPEAGFTLEQANASPIQARPAKSTFSEQRWRNEDATSYTTMGGDSAIYGSGVLPGLIGTLEFPIVIDLLKGPADFRKAFADAMKSGQTIAISLTSAIDPQVVGQKGVYRVYSKDTRTGSYRPSLRITLAR